MDDILEILKIIVAVLTLGFGFYTFFQPQPVAKASHFSLNGGRGMAEFRIAVGGFFIGLGVMALLINQDAAYQTLGGGYLAAAAVRVISYFMDDLKFDRVYVGLFAFEFLAGLILVA